VSDPTPDQPVFTWPIAAPAPRLVPYSDVPTVVTNTTNQTPKPKSKATSGRGWSSEGLPTVGDDDKLWTVSEASQLLGPPELTPSQVRSLVRLAALEPVGKRRTTRFGTSGRHARVYKAEELIKAYDRLVRFTEEKN